MNDLLEDDYKPITPREIVRQIVDSEQKKVLCSPKFWFLFMSLSYSLSIPLFFMTNVKNFGFQYFSDNDIAYVAYIGTITSVIARLVCGVCADKFGILTVMIFDQVLVIIAVQLFYFFSYSYIAFLVIMGIFYMNHGICCVLVSSLMSFVYGVDVGMAIQPIMQASWVIGGLFMVILDACIFGVIGVFWFMIVVVGLNLIVVGGCLVFIRR